MSSYEGDVEVKSDVGSKEALVKNQFSLPSARTSRKPTTDMLLRLQLFCHRNLPDSRTLLRDLTSIDGYRHICMKNLKQFKIMVQGACRKADVLEKANKVKRMSCG